MLEWMLGSTQGSHAHALRGESMAPCDLSQLKRLEGVRSAAKHRLRISTMLSAAPWPNMLEIGPPLRQTRTGAKIHSGQHAFAFFFH